MPSGKVRDTVLDALEQFHCPLTFRDLVAYASLFDEMVLSGRLPFRHPVTVALARFDEPVGSRLPPAAERGRCEADRPRRACGQVGASGAARPRSPGAPSRTS